MLHCGDGGAGDASKQLGDHRSDQVHQILQGLQEPGTILRILRAEVQKRTERGRK